MRERSGEPPDGRAAERWLSVCPGPGIGPSRKRILARPVLAPGGQAVVERGGAPGVPLESCWVRRLAAEGGHAVHVAISVLQVVLPSGGVIDLTRLRLRRSSLRNAMDC